MTDITNVSVPKNAGAKPRLSLLSSRQSCTKLRSEDSLDQPSDLDSPIYNLGTTIRDDDNAPARSSTTHETKELEAECFVRSDRKQDHIVDGGVNDGGPTTSFRHLSNGSLNADVDKMSISKEDLIRLLSMLKAELQSKEIALASIKLEQLKRLMNPVEISRSDLATTYIKLQDRLKANDRSRNSNGIIDTATKDALSQTSASGEARQAKSEDDDLMSASRNTKTIKDSDQICADRDDVTDQENFTILNTLLELLDRHPLLALPRDSIYCLDYNCNELSTKNYLNLKIQHLENLIDQHRRFRYLLGERLKRSEQRYMDLTLKLELEKNLKIEHERSTYNNGGRTILLKHIDQLKEALEKEKASKHAIVMTLLNELLDERERNGTLNLRIAELEGKLSECTKARPSSELQSSSVASQQSVCKPRVPAKPAQLLDRQLSQTKIGNDHR